MRRNIHFVAMVLVMFGAFAGIFLMIGKVNLIQSLLGPTLARIVYVVIGLAALYVAFQRETYLPFLGETVIPCAVLQAQVPEHADTDVAVHGLVPGAKVLYWASEPATDGLARINDWRKAYLEFANAGVAVVDEAGHVVLRIRKPQPYAVPLKGRLEAHVHWRTCSEAGFLGPVETTPIPDR
jgi:uncharacterized membrane protein YuzA (DUF378 family)